MILGTDLGNVMIKTSTRVAYPNLNTIDERLYADTDGIRVEFEGVKRVMGIGGEYKTDYQKSQKQDTLLNLFTSIALSTKDICNKVVMGLPVQQYKNDKSKLEKYILENNVKELWLNDQFRQIMITDLKVFPESLAAYYSLNQEIKTAIGRRDIVIIDIGGRTTDICLYSIVEGKRKLLNYITLPAGTLNIYSDFIQAINDEFGLDKLKEESEQIIREGLWVDGEKVKLNFTKPIFEKYTERILSELRLNYPIRTAATILCGGGGNLLKGIFMNQIKGLVVIEDVFCNATGFKRVGENLWNSGL